MPTSMTGCGEGMASAAGSSCRVELRSVNNRAFKFSLRAREGLIGLEGRAEALVRRRVRRGTIHMGLDLTGPAAVAPRRIDRVQLAAYLDDLDEFCAGRVLAVPRAVDALLDLPGVTCEAAADSAALEAAWPMVAEAIERALDALDRMRRAEGQSLAGDMLGACDEIGRLVVAIRGRVPEAVARHRERLHERVAAVLLERGVALTEADVAREVALVADRSDIAEELVRLESHLDQFRSLLAEDSTGRQLDFLAQELAREANTVAAKSADVGIAHAVVEVKTLVDRLREQVQNLE